MKKKVINKNIITFNFPTQYLACATFMRLSEFYESDFKGIRGKFFTTEEYMDRYAKENKNFTYTSDWGGFNVPGNVVNEFIKVFKSDLNKKETALIDSIKKSTKGLGDDYYVLGSYGADNETIRVMKHEFSHAFYYLDKEFKKNMDVLTKQITEKKYARFEKSLIKIGYTKKVIKDEIQAYMSTSPKSYMLEWKLPYWPKQMANYRKIFYKKYRALKLK